MTRWLRLLPRTLLPLFVLMSLVSPALAATPNIILMMADDMGMGDTSAYQDFTGNSDVDQISTPNMERLARMGVRFTDAHTPSTRCTATRYGLLTGRYPWRSRLKHWVLFGSQGDPLIESDRPTLATFLRAQGYATAMVGKWHVGLRYRRANGTPASGWQDADLSQPLHDTPLDHGFDFCRFTSRSHGTSGPDAGKKVLPQKKRNGPDQNVGPGHLHGREAVSATGDGKRLVDEGPHAYKLTKLGSRHLRHAIEFLDRHQTAKGSQNQPFFLYYPSNSNHGPYTPAKQVDGVAVAGAARNVAGDLMNPRADFVYENDVVLGKLIDYLEEHEDPRNPGQRLIDNTIVIFTSDNGAERDHDVSTGPFRSHKGSCYEGGHRVPFIVSWPSGGVGNGDASSPGTTSHALIGLQDMFATFADVLSAPLPNLLQGEKGAEDSVSVLSAWRGETIAPRPMFYNDHKQAKPDPAAVAVRLDDPVVGERRFSGKWKMFCDANLLRRGEVSPTELFELASDPREQNNRLEEDSLRPLLSHLEEIALRDRTATARRLADHCTDQRIRFDWQSETTQVRDGIKVVGLAKRWNREPADSVQCTDGGLECTVSCVPQGRRFSVNANGLGLSGGKVDQFDHGEAFVLQFNRDVIVESVAIVAGNGTCGGFYQVGDGSPLEIYCVDADNDAQDQSGIISDIGVLPRGRTLRLDSSPLWEVEAAGQWRIGAVTVRFLKR